MTLTDTRPRREARQKADAPALPQPGPASPKLRPPRFGALRTMSALILREVGSTYGRSPGGYIWAIIEPLGMIFIMSLVFSFIVRSPSLGNSFILFFATGFLPYAFYSVLEGKTTRALKASSGLMAYPRILWIDVILARFTLTACTELLTISMILSIVVVWVDEHVIIDIIPMILALTIAALGGLGVGMINSLLNALFPLWRTIWSILTRPLMIASAVLYTYEDLPSAAQAIIWWNPLVHVTGLFRKGVYNTYEASYVSLIYCYGLGLVLVALGLLFLRAWYKKVLEA